MPTPAVKYPRGRLVPRAVNGVVFASRLAPASIDAIYPPRRASQIPRIRYAERRDARAADAAR